MGRGEEGGIKTNVELPRGDDIHTYLHGALPAEVSIFVGVDRGEVVLRDLEVGIGELLLDASVCVSTR